VKVEYLKRRWARMNKRVEKQNNQCFNKGCKFKRSRTSLNKYNSYLQKVKFASLNWERIEASGRNRRKIADGVFLSKDVK
jgi:hypothetical protein